MQRYPACCWLTDGLFLAHCQAIGWCSGFLLPHVVWVCHHFLDDEGINAIYLNIKCVCIMPSSRSGRRSSERSTCRMEYEEYTIINPVLNWIMICVLYIFFWELLIKLKPRYELLNNLTTLIPLLYFPAGWTLQTTYLWKWLMTWSCFCAFIHAALDVSISSASSHRGHYCFMIQPFSFQHRTPCPLSLVPSFAKKKKKNKVPQTFPIK